MDLIEYLERHSVDVATRWNATDETRKTAAQRAAEAEIALAANSTASRLLGGRSPMICMVIAPDDGDSQLPEQMPDEPLPTEDSPDEEELDLSSKR